MAIKGNPFASPRKVHPRMSSREAERIYLTEEAKHPVDEAVRDNVTTDREEAGLGSESPATTSRQQSDNKPDTNRTQTEHKSRHKPDTNRAQSEHGAFTTKTQTGHKPDTQPDTRVDTNRTQTEHKPNTKARVTELVGLQRKLVLLVYRSCQSARARISDPLTIEHVAASLEIPTGSVKTSFRRLEDKGFVKRQSFKNGRGGWAKFELPDDVFNALLQIATEHKPNTNRAQSGHKPDTQPDTQPDTSLPSSSSYINKKFKPTTTAETRGRAEDVWTPEDLDYSMLVDIGFGRSQALQLRSLGLSFDVVQRSLVYFEFELRYTASGKTIQEPLALLMKRMRQNGCWEAPEEYTKRQAHFISRFNDGEQQLQEKGRAEEKSSDFLETGGRNLSPFDADQGQLLR